MRAAARVSRPAGARGDQEAQAQGELLNSPPREPDSPFRVGLFFARELDPDPTEVSRYIDEHRGPFGVEPICQDLGVSVSAHDRRASGERSARVVEDERLLELIKTTHAKNYYAYGYGKMWKALLRAGELRSALPNPAADARPTAFVVRSAAASRGAPRPGGPSLGSAAPRSRES